MISALADLCTLLATTLFPLYASYKALRSPDPIALSPWLTFYVTVSVIYLLESTVLYPLRYIPGYALLRLGLHLYLLAPAPEGASRMYTTYIEPFMAEHERDIENFIATLHDRGKTAGLQYLKQGMDWIRVNLLGQTPTPTPPPPTASYTSYAQQLLSRFYGGTPGNSVPSGGSSSATAGGATGAGGYGGEQLFGAIASVLQAAATRGSGGKDGQREARQLAESGLLIPPQYSKDERVTYARQAVEGLRVLMQAMEREEAEGDKEDGANLSKSRSETEFDKIEREEVSPEGAPKMGNRRTSTGGWMPWNWSPKPEAPNKKDEGEDSGVDVPAEGKSSGIDVGH